jgi:hypothetical protein
VTHHHLVREVCGKSFHHHRKGCGKSLHHHRKAQHQHQNYPIRESLAVSEKRRGGTAYNYDVVVCFQADKTISLISYFCCKSLQGGRNFSPEEVEYLLAMSGGTSFREVPTGAVQDLHVPDFGAAYPNQTFTGWIPEDSPLANDASLSALQGKRVRVTGTISLYRGKPEIKIISKSQIEEE